MSDEAAVVIAGLITFALGGAGAYAGLALIRNLHGLNDRLLRNYEDRPGGWRRADHDDSSHRSEGVGFSISFEFVPKTRTQAAAVGWVVMLVGLFMAAVGVLLVVAALLGNVE